MIAAYGRSAAGDFKRDDPAEVRFGTWNLEKARWSYRETIAKPVIGAGHFEPLRHYAEVHLLLEPGDPGSGVVLDTACREDLLDRNWQRLILTHLAEKDYPGSTDRFSSNRCEDHTAGRACSFETYGGRRLPAGNVQGSTAGP